MAVDLPEHRGDCHQHPIERGDDVFHVLGAFLLLAISRLLWLAWDPALAGLRSESREWPALQAADYRRPGREAGGKLASWKLLGRGTAVWSLSPLAFLSKISSWPLMRQRGRSCDRIL